MPLHVVIADDHAIVRQGLRLLLEREQCEVVREAENGQEAVRLVEKLSPRTKTILLTMLTEAEYVLESLCAGVRGYVLKSNSNEELVHAIRDACDGKVYLTPAASTTVV